MEVKISDSFTISDTHSHKISRGRVWRKKMVKGDLWTDPTVRGKRERRNNKIIEIQGSTTMDFKYMYNLGCKFLL